MRVLDSTVIMSWNRFERIPEIFKGIVVKKSFYVEHNKLTTLQNSPRHVHWHFDCSYNKLRSLVGGPERVGGNFHVSYNKLTSLEGFPNSVGGDVYAVGCGFNETQIREVCNIAGDVIV